MSLASLLAKAAGVVGLGALGGCLTIGEVGDADLSGRVVVEWDRQDAFIYRKTDRPLTFRPSFMTESIVPEDMFTDGGSVPQIFWGIPGLSPWGLGPAYIIHDWLFEVHRCDRDAPERVKTITFEESALILAEVGKALIDAGLIDDDMLGVIVAAVRTRYARTLWDRPATVEECRPPVSPLRSPGGLPPQIVADFEIPPPLR